MDRQADQSKGQPAPYSTTRFVVPDNGRTRIWTLHLGSGPVASRTKLPSSAGPFSP